MSLNQVASSYVLTQPCWESDVWRGQTHSLSVFVCLWFVEEEIERKQFLELTQPLNTWLKVKPCEPVKS